MLELKDVSSFNLVKETKLEKAEFITVDNLDDKGIEQLVLKENYKIYGIIANGYLYSTDTLSTTGMNIPYIEEIKKNLIGDLSVLYYNEKTYFSVVMPREYVFNVFMRILEIQNIYINNKNSIRKKYNDFNNRQAAKKKKIQRRRNKRKLA